MSMLAEDQKYTVEQRLDKTHYWLSKEPEYRFIGAIARHGEYIISDSVPTAATNGLDVWYNPDFVQTLNDRELRFVVIHEQFHKMFKHVFILKNLRSRDPLLANMAADYCINPMILATDPNEINIALPRDENGKVFCLIDDAFDKLSTIQIFDILWKENQEEEEEEEGGEDCEGGIPSGDGSTPSDNGLSGQTTNAEDEINQGKYSQKIRERMGKNHDDHIYDEITEDKELSSRIEGELNRAIRQATQIAGEGGGNFVQQVKELMKVTTCWKDVLKEFMKTHVRGQGTTTFRRFNRKTIGSRLYLPSRQSKETGEVIVAIDASASCWSVVPQFLSEIQVIAKDVKPQKIRLLYWDSEVEREEEYEKAEYNTLIQSARPSGGGGTDPTCAYEYIHSRINSGVYTKPISCVIILTDGYFYNESYGDWQSLKVPVLWGINSNGDVDFNPKFGQKIIINEDE